MLHKKRLQKLPLIRPLLKHWRNKRLLMKRKWLLLRKKEKENKRKKRKRKLDNLPKRWLPKLQLKRLKRKPRRRD